MKAAWYGAVDWFCQQYSFVEAAPSGKKIAHVRVAKPVALEAGWETRHPGLVETIEQANKALAAIPVAHQGVVEAHEEADGYDVVYQVAELNKNATLRLDYSGQSGQQKQLREIIFTMQCGKPEPFVAAVEPLITQVLSGIGTLQASDRRPKVSVVPPAQAQAAAIRAWVEDRVVNLMDRAVQINGKDPVWTNLKEVAAVIQQDQTFSSEEKQKLGAYLASTPISSQWNAIAAEATKRTSAGATVSTNDAVEAALVPLVQHELARGAKLKGNFKVVGYQGGNAVVSLVAAYPMGAVLKRQGGTLQLRALFLTLCDMDYTVTTPTAAKQLVSTMVTLARARKNTAAPGLSQEPGPQAPAVDWARLSKPDLQGLMDQGVVAEFVQVAPSNPQAQPAAVVAIKVQGAVVSRVDVPELLDPRRPTPTEQQAYQEAQQELLETLVEQTKPLGLDYWFSVKQVKPGRTRVEVKSLTGQTLHSFTLP
jgi:hypothetical protein